MFVTSQAQIFLQIRFFFNYVGTDLFCKCFTNVFLFFSKVPEELMANVTSQIAPVRPVPRKLTDYSEKEIKDFPKLFEYPKDFVADTKTPPFIVQWWFCFALYYSGSVKNKSWN